MSSTHFNSLPLSQEMLSNIESLGYTEMTAIQAQSLPLVMQGKDILAQSKTGSGKTAAFSIGLLHQLQLSQPVTQALVLCPTRELADQVSTEIRRLARSMHNTKLVTLCGGKAMRPQLASLERAPHIVVGTPGRVLKHLEKESLDLSTLKKLVLDEADRMLDMGFYDEMMEIIKQTPKQKQTLLFSATYPEEIQTISNRIQNQPRNIRIESVHDESVIEQVFYPAENNDKTQAVISILKHHKPEQCLIFCNTKAQCQILMEQLQKQGFSAQSLHGDLDQRERDRVIIQFANKSCCTVIATDVAARGIDIKELPMVINYELAFDPEVHIHRIGRTGRSGQQGLALSLFTEREKARIEILEALKGASISMSSLGNLNSNSNERMIPMMVSLGIQGGRKQKLRAGDILGALTASKVLRGDQIGKIDILDSYAYVAVEKGIAEQAYKILSRDKIKGKSYRITRFR